jgi:hypothetical protein
MSQVSGISATAPGRSLWRVLRPALVLSGFVAVWWALTTGVAHAESSPHGLGDSVRAAAKAHTSPVRDVARRVHHDARPATAKVTTHVRQKAAPVTRTMSAVVDSTPVAPVKAAVTETVRSGVSETVEKTRSLLAKTAADHVGDPVKRTDTNVVEKPESSTGQGNSGSKRVANKASASSLTTLPSSAFAQQFTSSAAPGEQPASIEAELPLDGPGGVPPVHEPCTSPGGSASTSATPVGVTESSWLVMPSVLRDLPPWCLARLPGGPAYQPGSSPD